MPRPTKLSAQRFQQTTNEPLEITLVLTLFKQLKLNPVMTFFQIFIYSGIAMKGLCSRFPVTTQYRSKGQHSNLFVAQRFGMEIMEILAL